MLVSLETRWAQVDRGRPGTQHLRCHCRLSGASSRRTKDDTPLVSSSSSCSCSKQAAAGGGVGGCVTCSNASSKPPANNNSNNNAQSKNHSSNSSLRKDHVAAQSIINSSNESPKTDGAKCEGSDVSRSGGCCGLCTLCLGYVAPEVRSPLYVPIPASDWWSVGALLYHLLTGQVGH